MILDLNSVGFFYGKSSKFFSGENTLAWNLHSLSLQLDTLTPDYLAHASQKRCDHLDFPIFDYSTGKIIFFFLVTLQGSPNTQPNCL